MPILKWALGMAVLSASLVGCNGSAAEPQARGPAAEMPSGFAAHGRLEGSSEPIEVGAAIDGTLESVLVEEGDSVSAGQVLARVACQELSAVVSAAEADARAAQLRLLILRRGTRSEDLDLARARMAAALAAKNGATHYYERMRMLWEAEGLVSADQLDRATRENEAAEANFLAASAEANRAEAGPLPEEVAEAEARAERARHAVAESKSRFDKCQIKSPVTGTVLKKFLQPGEAVSTVVPRPVLTVASLTEWTVRAEVDEHDVDRVRENMAVVVTSPAWGSREYHGVVKRISYAMGRRRVRSGDPAEKSDRDVREVIVALSGRGFVVGLRVDVRFTPGT